MIKRVFFLIILISGIIWNNFTFGQSTDSPSIGFERTETLQKGVLRDYYFSRTGFMNDLIFGQEYYPYHNQSKNKPTLYTDNLYSTSLVFDGKQYDDVKLQYDAFSDEVIYSDIELFLNFSSYLVALNDYLIESFSFYRLGDTLTFYYLGEGESNLPARFYEVVYSGQTKFLIKHYCSVFTEKTIPEYIIKEAYYLDTGNGFNRFRGKRQFLRLFGEKSETVRILMEEKGIRFEKKNKSVIADILVEFDNL